MSTKVVPAPANEAKRLDRNEKPASEQGQQHPAKDDDAAPAQEQEEVRFDESVSVANPEDADEQEAEAVEMSLEGSFSFEGALADAAAGSASLVAEAEVADEAGLTDMSQSEDRTGGTILLVGAVALAGLGVAVLADGNGKGDEDLTPPPADGPSFTSGDSADVDENVPATTVVYDAEVTGSGTVTFALSGADAEAFTIDTATGEVRFVDSPDFEAKDSYAITVTATDSVGSASKDVTIAINDVNEAPVAGPDNVTSVVVDEDDSVEFALDYSDPDGDDLAYSVGEDQGPANGVVTVGEDGVLVYTPDEGFSGEDSFTVTISDGELTVDQVVTVTVGDGGPAPGDSISLDVGLPSGAPVAIDVSEVAAVLTDDAAVNTNVVISGFGEDDIIELTGADVLDYSFGTGTGAGGSNDLRIEYADPSGSVNIILIEDVLVNPGIVSSYDSAVAAVGFNFITLG